MSRFPGPFGQQQRGGMPLDYEARIDNSVLVTFFNSVYAWMAAGLALTAVVAWVAAEQGWVIPLFRSGFIWVLFIAELALVFTISAAVNRISAGVATGLFLLYAALNGVTLGAIFLVYTQASIASTFLVCAATFAATSVYGMVTRRDLSAMGSLLFMALIGLVIASLVNMFWANSTLYWVISYAGVLIFVGLTAWDTQKLKMIAYQTQGDPKLAARLAISGSLALYLDFINLFLFLLRFMGKRR